MSKDEGLLINPNTAEIEALTQLPGVGEALARRMIEARPFIEAEDLLRVPGVGKATLERLAPHVVFEEELSIPAEEEADKPDMEVPRDLPKPIAPKDAAGQATYSRAATLWLILGTVLVSVSLAVMLNLAILDGINNTLNIGKHSSVRQLANDMVVLQADVDELASLITSIDRRMEAVEGLGGRVVSVEKEFSELHENITQSIEKMDAVHEQIDELTQQMDLLSESVSGFDTFLNGLRQLLIGSSSSIEPGSTPQP